MQLLLITWFAKLVLQARQIHKSYFCDRCLVSNVKYYYPYCVKLMEMEWDGYITNLSQLFALFEINEARKRRLF